MQSLLDAHRSFQNQLWAVSSYNDNGPSSALPSLVFYIGLVMAAYQFFHRFSRRQTRWKLWLYREMMMQFVLFYMLRIWFFVCKGVQQMLTVVVSRIYDHKVAPKESLAVNLVGMSMLILLSLLPFALLIYQALYDNNNMHNLFIWFGEDPWQRNEIGVSGHYLIRPPVDLPPPAAPAAFRSGRSCSINDFRPPATTQQRMRACPSA